MSSPVRRLTPLPRRSDAEDAVHARDGYDFEGYRLRVEFPRGRERGPGGAFLGSGGSRDRNGRDRDRDSGRGRAGGSRRSQFRVIVSGQSALLPAPLLTRSR